MLLKRLFFFGEKLKRLLGNRRASVPLLLTTEPVRAVHTEHSDCGQGSYQQCANCVTARRGSGGWQLDFLALNAGRFASIQNQNIRGFGCSGLHRWPI